MINFTLTTFLWNKKKQNPISMQVSYNIVETIETICFDLSCAVRCFEPPTTEQLSINTKIKYQPSSYSMEPCSKTL